MAVKAGGRKRGAALTRLLAAGAAIWTAGWLALVMTPTGLVPVCDRGYALLFSRFVISGRGDFLSRRIVELLALLPAALLLVAAQAHRQRRHEGGRLRTK